MRSMTRRRRAKRAGPSIRVHLALMLLIVGIAVPLILYTLPPPRPAPLPEGEAGTRIEAALPDGIDPLRRDLVRGAAALVGRVGYFWGGKSDCLGWDERWGVPAVVTSAGSKTTGKQIPFGLDCSGYVSWAAVNAAGTAEAFSSIGNGVREQWSHCAAVDEEDALPGDLAFFPDLSHIGIVAGRGEDGALLVLHCSSSLGGVVCSADADATGFTQYGRPEFFSAFHSKSA